MTSVDFDLIVFDLGGVLVHHNGLPFARTWSGNPDLSGDEFWQRWLASPAARTFEAGRIAPPDFAQAIIGEFGLHLAPEDFLAGFRTWISGAYDGADELVAGLSDSGKTLATLSNTNVLHWDHLLHDMPFMQRFDRHFPSHLTGWVKPDRAAFDHVVLASGVAPSRVVFLDDNATNVEGARAAGWNAAIAHGVEGARVALGRLGLETSRAL